MDDKQKDKYAEEIAEKEAIKKEVEEIKELLKEITKDLKVFIAVYLTYVFLFWLIGFTYPQIYGQKSIWYTTFVIMITYNFTKNIFIKRLINEWKREENNER